MCSLSSAEAPLYRGEAGEREKKARGGRLLLFDYHREPLRRRESDVRKIFLLFGRRPNRVIEIACFD